MDRQRWYDKIRLGEYIRVLGKIAPEKRKKILTKINEIINQYDKDLIINNVMNFTLAYKRRWYDKDPYSWLIINSLKYVNEDKLNQILIYMEKTIKLPQRVASSLPG